MIFLVHTRARTVAAADIVRNVWGHGRQEGVTWGNWPQAVVPNQLFHFAGPRVSVGVPSICRDVVKGNGAIVEVQRSWWRHFRRAIMLVDVRWTVPKNGLLFDGSCHKL